MNDLSWVYSGELVNVQMQEAYVEKCSFEPPAPKHDPLATLCVMLKPPLRSAFVPIVSLALAMSGDAREF